MAYPWPNVDTMMHMKRPQLIELARTTYDIPQPKGDDVHIMNAICARYYGTYKEKESGTMSGKKSAAPKAARTKAAPRAVPCKPKTIPAPAPAIVADPGPPDDWEPTPAPVTKTQAPAKRPRGRPAKPKAPKAQPAPPEPPAPQDGQDLPPPPDDEDKWGTLAANEAVRGSEKRAYSLIRKDEDLGSTVVVIGAFGTILERNRTYQIGPGWEKVKVPTRTSPKGEAAWRFPMRKGHVSVTVPELAQLLRGLPEDDRKALKKAL